MITLEKLIEILKEDKNFISNASEDSLSFDALSYDSRTVTASTLFFAKGSGFKSDYLHKLAAPLYVSEIDYEVETPVLLVKDIKRAMSLAAQAFYDYPQKKLKTLAFTGTKGKTTSAYFAKSILDEMNGGTTALLSTAYTTLDGKAYTKSELTTPESIDLVTMMADAVENGMTHMVLEVSSQAYKKKRVYGLTFDVGVFLNLSPDHIGPLEHPDFKDYFRCKRQLLDNSNFAIVNSESDRFADLSVQVADKPHLFYGSDSDNKITKSSGLRFKTAGVVAGGFEIQLLGRFNQENALATALATHVLGASLANIKAGLAKTRVPGRMETFTAASGAKVYVDYAHNGLALESLVEVVEEHHEGKIFLVLGATGNKGENRRRDFGEIIQHHLRLVPVLTADDPNYEDPEKIAHEIACYIARTVRIEPDRVKAIREAIGKAQKATDAVIIAGKGEDQFQIVKGAHEPYEGDRKVVEKILKESKKR